MVASAYEAARGYAELGFFALPVARGEKGPRLPGWTEAARRAAGQPEACLAFAEKQPEWAWGGVALSPPPGWIVVDVDVPKPIEGKATDGQALLAAYEAEHGPLPATWEQRSPSGGRHLLFRLPDGAPIPERGTPANRAGLDLRLHGRHCFNAWPSVRVVPEADRKDGVAWPYEYPEPYRWLDAGPDGLPTGERADLPASFLAWYYPPEAPRAAPVHVPALASGERLQKWFDPVLSGCARDVRDAPEGTRNNKLSTAALRAYRAAMGAGVHESAVTSALENAAMSNGLKPPEIKATLTRALAKATQEGPAYPPERDRPPPARPALRTVASGGVTTADAGEGEDMRFAALAYSLDLDCSQSGAVKATRANVRKLLAGHPAMQGRLSRDTFADVLTVRHPVPWDKAPATGLRPWTEDDTRGALDWLSENGVEIKQAQTLLDAALQAASDHNPLHDYLNGLTWDGAPRVDRWLLDYAGADDTPANRLVGRLWLIAAVARAFEPGCKADCMLILEGNQGIGKSTLLKVLAEGDARRVNNWFTDEVHGTQKDERQKLVGKWVVEFSELKALVATGAEDLKQYLSATVDEYRKPYARQNEKHLRACIFAGSTNATTGYLRDETGNRRFWPVAVRRADVTGLASVRDQLWAEAVALYKSRAQWWPTQEQEAALEVRANDSIEADTWEEPVLRYITERPEWPPGAHGRGQPTWQPRPNALQSMTSEDLLSQAVGLDQSRMGSGDRRRVARILKRAGWTEKRHPKDGRRVRMWWPPEPVTLASVDVPHDSTALANDSGSFPTRSLGDASPAPEAMPPAPAPKPEAPPVLTPAAPAPRPLSLIHI